MLTPKTNQNLENYASFRERFFAGFIDYLCIALIMVLVLNLAQMLDGMPIVNDDGQLVIKIGLWHVFAIEWLYFAAQHSSNRRATLGMRMMRLHIVTMQHKQLSLHIASLRYMISLFSALIFWFGHFMMLFNELHQALHDKVAGTLVVREQPRTV